MGHKRSECKKTKPWQRNAESRQANLASAVCTEDDVEDGHYCFPVAIDSKNEGTSWYLDSGATEHLVRDDTYVTNVKMLSEPVKIKVAKTGQQLVALKSGEINVKTSVDGSTNQIVIKGVLIVSGLEYNLLSVQKLDMNGFKIVFENSKAMIMKENKVIAIAVRKTKLYELTFSDDTEEVNICRAGHSAELWHKRMGHISNSALTKLKELVDGIDFDITDEILGPCQYCVEGKQCKLPHNQERVRAKRPLQLVHSDLFGPIDTASYDGKRYVLTFIDDYTHFTVAYPLKQKSEVFHHFKMFEAMATAHFGIKLSRFRCDNGREYTSTEMKDHFEERGIQFEFTIRYKPQQNGVAERINRTIIEKSHCMLLNSKVSKSLWTEAVVAAVYLINRSPTSALMQKAVPAELWFGEKPKLGKIRIFGCVAYLHVPSELNHSKFESRTKKYLMVGYCTNGYRLWSVEDRKIYFGRDIIFDERKFSYESHGTLPMITNDDKESVVTENNGHQEPGEDELTESEKYDSAEEYQEPQDAPSEEDQETRDKNEELRRSTRMKVRQKYLEEYTILALNAETYVDDTPENYNDIEKRDDKEEWYRAVNEELDALHINNTWILTKLSTGKKAINNKWVFKVKQDEAGNVE